MNEEFEKQFMFGRVAESLIAKWLISKGHIIMPAYETLCSDRDSRSKGPQVFMKGRSLVAPDMLVFIEDKFPCWVESKHKTVFTWHRKTQKWETGIDRRYYREYLEVATKTKTDVYLLFFHGNNIPSKSDLKYGCPPECPTGLFAGNIKNLSKRVNHEAPYFNPGRKEMKGHGRSGMVYWAVDALNRLASKEQVFESAGKTPDANRVLKFPIQNGKVVKVPTRQAEMLHA